jgi:hypothetical protein
LSASPVRLAKGRTTIDVAALAALPNQPNCHAPR